MRKTCLFILLIFYFAGDAFSQVTISGSTGANATYSSLTNASGAFAALNATAAGSQAGNTIVITITADLTSETGANFLLNRGWTKLSILPSGGPRIVSGTVAGPLIGLAGSNYVTIDGLNSGGNSLTISNSSTSVSASTIRFSSGASDCKIINCTILGSTTATAATTAPGAATIYFTGNSGGSDRDTIMNNNIGNDAAGFPSMAIGSTGFASSVNDDNVVRSNNIYDWYSTSGCAAINAGQYNSGWTIDDNKLYQTAPRSGMISGNYFKFIYIGPSTTGAGFSITNNIMGYSNSSGTGMLTVDGGRLMAMHLLVGTSPASSIQGNTVNNIKWTSADASTIAGFSTINFLTSTAGKVDVGNISGNIFGSLTGTGSPASGIYLTSTTSTDMGIFGIYIAGAAASAVQNNVIGAINANGPATSGFVFYGMRLNSDFSHIVTGNSIGGITPNSIELGVAGITTSQTSGTGIYANASGTGTTMTVGTAGAGNTIQNLTLNGSSSSSGYNGIFNTVSPDNLIINNNTFTGISLAGTGNFYHIYNQGVPAVSLSINNNNFVSATISASPYPSQCGFIVSITPGSPGSVSISNNSLAGLVFSGALGHTGVAGNCFGIFTSGVWGSLTIDNNNFNNLSLKSSGSFYMCSNNSASPIVSYSNNFITTGLSKTLAGGTLFAYFNGSSPASGTSTFNNNNFSNISLTPGTNFIGIQQLTGITHAYSITNNTFNNISTAPISSFIGLSLSGGAAGTLVSGNTLAGFTSGTSSAITGISMAFISSLDCYNNNIHGFSGTGAGTMNAIASTSGTGISIYKNKIYDLEANDASATVSGILVSGSTAGSTVNIHNNFISDLRNPSGNSASSSVTGINLTSAGTTSSRNVYYNSVYLDAISSGTNFSTTGLFHTASATATTATLDMRNNILVNTSTPNGTGRTVAYRRSTTALANFASASDYNLLYAGTPSANRLIFYDGTNSDQTLAAYKTRVTPREANSISLMPTFTSATDLHLTSVNCQLDGRGTPIGTITDDIDANVRNVTTPDIGADEFTSTTNTTLAGITGSAVCESRTIAGTGTIYTSNGCDLIARVEPRIGTPLAGNVNVCVRLETGTTFYNSEPYLLRHFDIEPVSYTSSTTARVTLYVLQSEFTDYNVNCGGFPLLPANPADASGKANLRITQYHGVWTSQPLPGYYPAGGAVLIDPLDADIIWNAVNNYWEISFDVTGFSGFFIHTTVYGFPLADKFISFNGRREGNMNLLNWKIANEQNIRGYEVQRSYGGQHFSSIGFVNSLAPGGNSTQQLQYSFADNNFTGEKQYYRLKQVTHEGRIAMSAVVLIKGDPVLSLFVNTIFPNPANDIINISLEMPVKEKLIFLVTDISGRVMMSKPVMAERGTTVISLPVEGLASGTYLLKILCDKGCEGAVTKFVKQ